MKKKCYYLGDLGQGHIDRPLSNEPLRRNLDYGENAYLNQNAILVCIRDPHFFLKIKVAKLLEGQEKLLENKPHLAKIYEWYQGLKKSEDFQMVFQNNPEFQIPDNIDGLNEKEKHRKRCMQLSRKPLPISPARRMYNLPAPSAVDNV